MSNKILALSTCLLIAHRRVIMQEVLVGQHDSSVQLVRQASVTSSPHHEANDHLAEGVERARKGGLHSGVSETKTNIATGKC